MQPYKVFFKNLSPLQWRQLETYATLLSDWNQKLNLVSRKETDIFEKHILPILPLAEFEEECLYFENLKTVLDVGTGGGIPGIPLAVIFPKVSFTLLDSIHKKTLAVVAMVRELQLPNVQVVCDRVEHLSGKYDACIGRGVTAFERFVRAAKKCLKPHGSVFYWSGGDIEDLVPATLRRKTRVKDLEAFFQSQYANTKKLLWYQR